MISTKSKELANSSLTMAGKQQKSFTGRVTKLINNFGFVDDDVFFQLSVVEGGNVRIGDQVYVECQYSEELPFKWNATKVEIMGHHTTQMPQVASTYLRAHDFASHTQQQQQQQQSQQQPSSQSSLAQGHSYYTQDQSQSHSKQHAISPYQTQDQSHQQAYSSEYSQNSQPLHHTPKQAQSSYNDYNIAKPAPFFQRQQQQTQQQQQQQQQQPSQSQEYSTTNQLNKFQQITYTSTPGSAFVTSEIAPYIPQLSQTPHQVHNQVQRMHNNRGNSTRWDEPRNRDDNRTRRNDREKNERERNDNRDNNRDRNRERRVERDRFNDNDREARRESRFDREKEHQRSRRSESPVSTTSTNDASHSGKPLRRRYDPVNIPKHSILKNIMNIFDIKQKYGAIHIPSDFREVRVNTNLDLKISDIPKPILYRIVDQKSEKIKSNDSTPIKTNGNNNIEKKNETESEPQKDKDAKPTEEKPIINKPLIDVKLPHKYAVKVLFISLPSINDIYDRVFGSDRDSFNSSKAYFLHFNKLFSFLAIRSSSEGHSLIGGKFDPHTDGFINNSDEPNLIATAIRCVKNQTGIDLTPCKRWKRISTFVYDREDSIKGEPSLEFSYIFLPDIWSLIEKAREFKKEEVVEDIEEKMEIKDDVLGQEKMAVDENVVSPIKSVNTTQDKTNNININDKLDDSLNLIDKSVNDDTSSALDLTASSVNIGDNMDISASGEKDLASSIPDKISANEGKMDNKESSINEEDANVSSLSGDNAIKPSIPFITSPSSTDQELLLRLNDLKVAELKTELDRRGVKIKGNVKKSELIVKLKQILEESNSNKQISNNNEEEDEDNVVSDSVKGNWWTNKIKTQTKEDCEKTDSEETQQSTDDKIDKINEINEKSDDLVESNVKHEIQETSDNVPQENDPTAETTSTETTLKRKLEDEEDSKTSDEPEAKKKSIKENTSPIYFNVQDGHIVASSDNVLSVITLYQTLNNHKYDHFELAITAEFLKEFLIRHFSNVILTTLVHNKSLKQDEKSESSPTPPPIKVMDDNSYIQLAFAYFDSCHCGYLLVEDLLRLFHNCNFPLSKKVWNSLFGSDEKQYYRALKEPTVINDYFKMYSNISSIEESTKSKKDKLEKVETGPIFIQDGNIYDVLQLISQSESDERTKVELREKVILLEDKLELQKSEINDFDGRQKKLTTAIEKQNDEICSLKREKETFKIKYEQMRKCAETTVNNFGELLKENKKE